VLTNSYLIISHLGLIESPTPATKESLPISDRRVFFIGTAQGWLKCMSVWPHNQSAAGGRATQPLQKNMS